MREYLFIYCKEQCCVIFLLSHETISKFLQFMSIEINKDSIAERFMRYVQVDTQSNPKSGTHPSTEKQKNLR